MIETIDSETKTQNCKVLNLIYARAIASPTCVPLGPIVGK